MTDRPKRDKAALELAAWQKADRAYPTAGDVVAAFLAAVDEHVVLQLQSLLDAIGNEQEERLAAGEYARPLDLDPLLTACEGVSEELARGREGCPVCNTARNHAYPYCPLCQQVVSQDEDGNCAQCHQWVVDAEIVAAIRREMIEEARRIVETVIEEANEEDGVPLDRLEAEILMRLAALREKEG